MTAVLHSLEACQGKAELKAEFVQLRAKGLPYVRIAERLGVAKSTLANWNAELEAEIASARAMELEALQEEFFLLKEGRITLLGRATPAAPRRAGEPGPDGGVRPTSSWSCCSSTRRL